MDLVPTSLPISVPDTIFVPLHVVITDAPKGRRSERKQPQGKTEKNSALHVFMLHTVRVNAGLSCDPAR